MLESQRNIGGLGGGAGNVMGRLLNFLLSQLCC